MSSATLYDLNGTERKVFSQNGEDGVIRTIFWILGEATRYCVEIGAGDGNENNTHLLVHQGWKYLWLDAAVPPGHPRVRRERVCAENIVPLFQRYDVPKQFDCLSIDTDFNDAFILTAILRGGYRPRLMVVEYNAACGPESSLSVQYDSAATWQGTNYFGASLAAFALIGQRFGYSLVYCENSGNNAFLVSTSLVDASCLRSTRELWRPPGYGGHPRDPQHSMVEFRVD